MARLLFHSFLVFSLCSSVATASAWPGGSRTGPDPGNATFLAHLDAILSNLPEFDRMDNAADPTAQRDGNITIADFRAVSTDAYFPTVIQNAAEFFSVGYRFNFVDRASMVLNEPRGFFDFRRGNGLVDLADLRSARWLKGSGR